MSSYDDTDALVPPGVHVPERPGVTLIPALVAPQPAPAPPPSGAAPPLAPSPTPPPAVALHPIQPQSAQTDAVVPPGVNVPRRPAITLITIPVAGPQASPPAPQPTILQPGPAATQPQSADDALVPHGAGRVPERPGITLVTFPASSSTTPGGGVGQGNGASETQRTPQSSMRDEWPFLTAAERQVAKETYNYAIRHGVSREHALELVAAAYRESTLRPGLETPAAGLFQLTGGYVTTANKKTGGVYSWRANLQTILPVYKQYWANNPQAARGEAASKVEISGASASWYGAPVSWLSSHLP